MQLTLDRKGAVRIVSSLQHEAGLVTGRRDNALLLRTLLSGIRAMYATTLSNLVTTLGGSSSCECWILEEEASEFILVIQFV